MGLFNDTTYYFTVTAVDVAGNESDHSNFMTAVPIAQAKQNIQIPEGWSGISSYICSETDNFDSLFSSVLNELIILQNASGMYWPGQNINTLGTWDTHQGYQIKVAGAVELTISGSKENNKTLQLADGWNIIPVLSECNVDIDLLFDGLDVMIVKEVAGYNIYWPEFGIYSLEELMPGKAYLVLTNAPETIVFPECDPAKNKTMSSFSPNPADEAGINKTAISHTIALPSSVLSSSGIFQNSLITANDKNGNCFGMAMWNGSTISITLFGDDPFTPQKDGFYDEDIIEFEISSPGNNHVIGLMVKYDEMLPQSDGLFHSNGLSAIREIQMGSSAIEEEVQQIFRVYPNPADKVLYVAKTFEGKAKLKLINVLGENVYEGHFAGTKTKIDISKYPAGVYFIKLNADGINISKRIVIK